MRFLFGSFVLAAVSSGQVPQGGAAENAARPPSPPTVLSVIDFGADRTGATDSIASFNRAMSAGPHVIIPAGVYRLSAALSVPANHSISGNGAVTLEFTGPTDGIQLPRGNGVEIEDLTLVTTNPQAGKAINAMGDQSGNVLRNVTITQQTPVAGARIWPYGLYAESNMESSSFYSLQCYNVTKCISLNGTSNANSFYSPMIGGRYAAGLEIIRASGTTVFGGTIQGDASIALVTTTGDLRMYGTWLENVHGTPALISTRTVSTDAAVVVLDGITNGTSSRDDVFRFSGPGSVLISNLAGTASAGGCVINHTGYEGSHLGTLAISNSTIWNFGMGSGICVGSAGSAIDHVSISDNYITAKSGLHAIVINGTAGMRVNVDGNYISSGAGYALNVGTGPVVSYSYNDFQPGRGPAGVCAGCTGNEVNVGNSLLGRPLPASLGSLTVNGPLAIGYGNPPLSVNIANAVKVGPGISRCPAAPGIKGCWVITVEGGESAYLPIY